MELGKVYLSADAIAETIGGGYGKFWFNRRPIIACKGGRGSKKSKTTALRLIFNIMKYPGSNAVVIRQVFDTHRQSTFAELKWAIKRWGVQDYWKATNSPLELMYLPTKQKIMFRGLDDPDKLASITVEEGMICWRWFEEAFEIQNPEVYDKLEMGLRGQLPEGLWKEDCFTFNPWAGTHWMNERFFKSGDPDVLAMTTTFLCNEFLDDADLRKFERMRDNNPRRFQIEGLGEWGMAEGLVYNNFIIQDFDVNELARARDYHGSHKFEHRCGLDFGFTNHPSAILDMWASVERRELYIWNEHYQRGMTNRMVAAAIHRMHLEDSRIFADSAEPKSIYEIKNDEKYPVPLIRGCKKTGTDSKRAGIQRLQDYKIIIHPRCVNTIIEINNYAWDKSKAGILMNEPIKDFDHLMDAMRYGTEGLGRRTMTTLMDS